MFLTGGWLVGYLLDCPQGDLAGSADCPLFLVVSFIEPFVSSHACWDSSGNGRTYNGHCFIQVFKTPEQL